LRALPLAAALPVALGGLALFALSLVVSASQTRIDSSPLGWALGALAVVGLTGFILGLLRRAAGLTDEVSGENETLRREGDALRLELADRANAYDDAVAVLAAAPLHLLLFDPLYQILGSYSPELGALFRERDLRDENLLGALRRVLPEPNLANARDFLAALFDERRSDAQVAELNPLRRVEVMLLDAQGASEPHVFAFGFRRIYRGGAIERALMWVEDLTVRLREERESRSRDAQKAHQFDLLLALVRVERAALDAFVTNAAGELRAIDGLLRAGDAPLGTQAGLLRERLAAIDERVRAIESAAGEIGFFYFVRRAAAYQAKVAAAAARETLGGDSFLELVMEQSAFRAELEELQALCARIDGPESPEERVAAASDEPAGAGSDEVVSEIEALARQLALVAHKEVIVDAGEFDTKTLSGARRELVRDVLAELLRNAVEHGIEDPATREAAGKPRAGLIQIRRAGNGTATGAFAFSFRDDGRGLDAPQLRERAVLHGLLAAGRAEAIDASQLAAFVFAPELTLGMPAVKRKVVDECGGSISVDSEHGAFCEFSFVLPRDGG